MLYLKLNKMSAQEKQIFSELYNEIIITEPEAAKEIEKLIGKAGAKL